MKYDTFMMTVPGYTAHSPHDAVVHAHEKWEADERRAGESVVLAPLTVLPFMSPHAARESVMNDYSSVTRQTTVVIPVCTGQKAKTVTSVVPVTLSDLELGRLVREGHGRYPVELARLKLGPTVIGASMNSLPLEFEPQVNTAAGEPTIKYVVASYGVPVDKKRYDTIEDAEKAAMAALDINMHQNVLTVQAVVVMPNGSRNLSVIARPTLGETTVNMSVTTSVVSDDAKDTDWIVAFAYQSED